MRLAHNSSAFSRTNHGNRGLRLTRWFTLLLVLTGVIAGTIGYAGKSLSKHLSALRVAGLQAEAAEATKDAGRTARAAKFTAGPVALPVGTTFEVNSTGDTDHGSCGAAPNCTLRDAINAANANAGADTITFNSTVFAAPGPYTISLTGALPDITTDMTIQGPGAKVLTVRRNAVGFFRIFFIHNGATASISDLTATNGAGPSDGGGIRVGDSGGDSGTLTLTRVAVTGNSSPDVGGGGISVNGGSTLNVVESTISGNNCGPASYGGGGILNLNGTLTVVNSTISGNNAHAASNFGGGGIYTNGPTTLSNSTITKNTAAFGGGVYANILATVTLKSTLIGDNTTSVGGSNPDVDDSGGRGTFNSNGFSLIENTTGATIHEPQNPGTNIYNQDPQLNPLADNGGPTMTHSLLCSSPAIDKGNSFGLTTDQRGGTRPLDGDNGTYPNATSGDAADIGAYESHCGVDHLTTLEVNSLADTDDVQCAVIGIGNGCTLREAINEANADGGAETITFNPTVFAALGPYTISLVTALPEITTDMTIQGPGAKVLTVERNSGAATRFRIFTIASGTVAISGLTITKGFTADGVNSAPTGGPGDAGGGISNNGTLTLTAVAVSGNKTGKGGSSTNGGFGGNGGGISNAATLTINSSTISGNQAGDGGNATGSNGVGGFGGGIHSVGTLTVTNSTISGNQSGAPGTGGAGAIGGPGGGIASGDTLTISNCTITANTATANDGGGIRRISGTVNLKSSIVAGNSAGVAAPDIFHPSLISRGYNLVGTSEGGGFYGPTDRVGTSAAPLDPQLNPLGDNGGPTQTHSLKCTSPAIDRGNAFGLITDQRGITRTLDLADASYPNASGGDGTDIGAYETLSAVGCVSVTPLEVNSKADTHDGSCDALGTGIGNKDCTLREAISVANVDPNAQTITFNSTVFAAPGPHPISLLTALPNITTNVTIQGPGANLLTVQRSTAGGTPDFTVFIIVSSTVNISGLTISNGSAPFGGGVINAGTLTLTNCTVSGNTAGGQGGGGVTNTGTLTLTNCTVSGNTTVGAGGGLASSGTLTVINSTVSGNTSLFPGPNNGGGGLLTAGSATLSGSAVIGNTGGGILSAAGALTLTNSTVSGNTATHNGGGIFANSGTLALVNSTVTNNRSDSDNSGAEQGGGYFRAAGTVTLKNTIVAGNFRGTGTTRDDIGGAVDATSSFNLIGDGTNMTGISNGSNGNLVGSAGSPIDAMLGALGNNGGPTQTHPLLLGSPAINAGSNGNLPADTLDLNNNGNTGEPLPIDQRGVGFPRIVQTTVDIGAVEVNYAISATAGTPQSATVNTTFSTALKATVTESGIPQNNVSVTFTAPGSGASGTFPGPSTTAVAVTNSSGLATGPTFTANGIAGPYNVVASLAGNLAPTSFSLTNLKINQTINFSPIAGKTFGDPDFTVSPTASSGLQVSLAPSGNCTVTNLSPGMVHITGAGSCTITASQIGDASFNAATDVLRSFNISKAFANPSVTSSVNPADLNQSVTFTATLTGPSGTGTPTGTVQFKDGGTNLGTPVTLNASGAAQLTTSTLTTGNHNITADYSGDTNFLTVTGTLAGGQVVKFQPTLSINDVSIAEGHSGASILNFTVTLSAASSLTVTANYATANGTATAPSDYTAIASTLLTFNPGDTSKTVAVTINGDISFEPDETFTVNLTNPTNTTITKAAGNGTIQNDDAQGGFFSFSPATYNVSEATGLVTVTVIRTNDVTQAANVDYATDDTGASTNCAALNTGLAAQRCDYTSVFGTLKFAANETQKTIDIPINLDAYIEGPENFTVKLSNPTGGAALIAPSSALVTINDSASPTPNAIDDTADFVRQQYHDFLNRDADPSGLAFWKNNIDKCNDPAQRPPGQTVAQCIEVQRILTSAAFFLSIEFRQTGGLVRDFYVASLFRPLTNNMPDYVEFMRDTQAIQRGVVVNQGNWQQTLDTNREAFMNEFVTRAEFVALYPTTDTPTQYVDRLYQHANVTGTQQERLDAIAYFGGAVTAADTGARARALLRVTESGDFQAREANRTFVQIEYFGYLRRNPNDAPDNNFDGYNFWVNKLIQVNGDFLQAEMVKAFLRSSEYRARFGP